MAMTRLAAAKFTVSELLVTELFEADGTDIRCVQGPWWHLTAVRMPESGAAEKPNQGDASQEGE